MLLSGIVPIAALVAMTVGVMAAPTPQDSQSDPATVNFAPFKYVGCRMSQDPYDPEKPVAYNVTTGYCITPPYAFASYVESANTLAANGPCSLSIFPQPDCQGQGVAGVRTTYGDCVTDENAAGQSLMLTCGP